MRRKRDPMAGVIVHGGKQPANPPPRPIARSEPPKPPSWERSDLARAHALIAWIDGACTDQKPHAEIEAAITRYYQEANR